MKSNYLVSNTPSPSSSGGIGCLTLLGIIFIVLKLTGNISWSWWWVLSPFIAQASIGILAIIVVIAVTISRRS